MTRGGVALALKSLGWTRLRDEVAVRGGHVHIKGLRFYKGEPVSAKALEWTVRLFGPDSISLEDFLVGLPEGECEVEELRTEHNGLRSVRVVQYDVRFLSDEELRERQGR